MPDETYYTDVETALQTWSFFGLSPLLWVSGGVSSFWTFLFDYNPFKTKHGSLIHPTNKGLGKPQIRYKIGEDFLGSQYFIWSPVNA